MVFFGNFGILSEGMKKDRKHLIIQAFATFFTWSEWGDLNARPLEPHSSTE